MPSSVCGCPLPPARVRLNRNYSERCGTGFVGRDALEKERGRKRTRGKSRLFVLFKALPPATLRISMRSSELIYFFSIHDNEQICLTSTKNLLPLCFFLLFREVDYKDIKNWNKKKRKKEKGGHVKSFFRYFLVYEKNLCRLAQTYLGIIIPKYRFN